MSPPRSPCRRWLAAAVSAVAFLLVGAAAQAASARVSSGLVAYYPLTEGTGPVAVDHAVPGEPIDLGVTGRLSWLGSQNGIQLEGGRIGTPHLSPTFTPVLNLLLALKATGRSTFEVWVVPDNTTQSGPARILSLGPRMMLGQDGAEIEVRFLHTGKNSSAQPWLTTTDGPLTTGLTHLVHTYDGTQEILYVNGVAHPTTVTSSGDFSNWNDTGRLVLGHEAAVQPDEIYKGFPWDGTVRLVAIYDRALSPAEVATNFAASPGAPPVHAGPDRATQGLPGQPSQSLTLNGLVPGAPAVTTSWSVLSGPGGGVVTFGDPNAPVTTADFSVDGIYQLRLSGDDGASVATDDVTVAVNSLSSQIGQPLNLAPAAGAVGVSRNPALEVVCETGATAARWVIATDAAFTSIVHDSGESTRYTCSYVSFAALQSSTSYYWSARLRDDAGLWSDWSTPTQSTTADATLLSTVSLREGVNGYAGAADVDIRGLADDPFNPPLLVNQGLQPVLRAGRQPTAEVDNFRSLLRFDVSGLGDPGALLTAHIELTGWEYGSRPANDFEFEAPHSFFELLTPWEEGSGVFDPPAAGEVTWLHSEYPTTWAFPGAGGVGTDRDGVPLMQGRFLNLVGDKSYWSSAAFTDAVRSWMADPNSNQGFLLQADQENVLQVLKLAPKEHSDPGFRPRLVLEMQAPAEVALVSPGADFQAGGSTTVTLEVHYENGALVSSDNATQVIFAPSGSGSVAGVVTGAGDGGYGVPGGAEVVTVSGGVASITLENLVAETFSVSFANNAGLTDPAPDSIEVSAGPATQVVLSLPGADFATDASTPLTVEVQDVNGNRGTSDDTTQVIFSPSGGGSVAGVVTGTGDGGYGVPGGIEVVTVSAGVASITLTDLVAETFTVAFTNNAGLTNPAPDSIDVTAGAPSQLVLTLPGADFAAGSSTSLSVEVRDSNGNLLTSDGSTQVIFSPSGAGTVAGVLVGIGDGGYGVPGGVEVVTVSAGIASIALENLVAQTFTVGFANNAGLTDPLPDSIDVSPGAASQLVLTLPGADFAAGASTSLTVEVHDLNGNLVTGDSATQVIFSPSGSGTIAGVVTGTGDGSYGVPGGVEVVTVAAGLAFIALEDLEAETFSVGFANNAGLTNPAPDSIEVSIGAATQLILTLPGTDFIAGASTSLSIEVQDVAGNRVTADSTTQVVFSPGGSGTVAGVVTGTGDGGYGVPGGAEVVTVSAGLATVTLTDLVVETFTVAFTNNAGLTNPAPDSIDVAIGPAAQVALTLSGVDFPTGGSTSLGVEVQDVHGNRVSADSTTQVVFSPSGSGTITGVVTGTGDGGYGVPGGVEVVTVSSGAASIALTGLVVETFSVAFSNNAGLANPAPDSIDVTAGPPTQVLLTLPGTDFAAGASTSLSVEVRDTNGNLVTLDSTTQVILSPSGSGTITAVLTGTGDGGYGVPGGVEVVTVSAGIASITLENLVAQTFAVGFGNTGGLTNPAPDSIFVTPGAAAQLVLTLPGSDFAAGASTSLTVQVQDLNGNLVTADGTTQVTFSPSGSGTVAGVVTGIGDGGYGVPAGPETVTVAGGVASITLEDLVAETFSVGFANDAALTDPAPDSIVVTPGAAAQLVLTLPGSDFVAGTSTSLTVQVQDVNDNLVTSDGTTQVTFSPSGSGTVTAVLAGTGDGGYGVPGGVEVVTVSAGIASITLENLVAETFSVGFANDAALTDPAPDSIFVTPGAAAQLVLTLPGSDFAAGASTSLTVQVQDLNGNLVTADGTTQVTFSPSGSGTVAGVVTGTGDGGYGVPAGPETITVAGGVASITLENLVAETFSVGFANDAALTDPTPDSIFVTHGAAAQLVLTLPGSDFAADASTSLTVQVQDLNGNLVTSDGTTQVTFSPSGSGTVTAVLAGTGDGGYGVPAGPETVTVAGGVASITLENLVAETFSVGFANDAALTDPAPDSIVVSAGAASQLVLTLPGADFAVGESTSLSVEVQDVGGNLVTSDSATQVSFWPTGGGTVIGVVTGTGDGSYGVAGGVETVTVAGGVASITLEDLVPETFTVAFSNDAGLTDPAPDSIDVALGVATQVVLTLPGVDFPTGGSTDLGVEVQDAGGNLVTSDSTTQITFTPSGGGTLVWVLVGTGDDSYGVEGGAETVTVVGGMASIILENRFVETFTVSFANDAALADPAPDSIDVSAGAPPIPAVGPLGLALLAGLLLLVGLRSLRARR